MSNEIEQRRKLILSAEEQMAAMSRRSLLWAAGAVAASYGGWRWLLSQPKQDRLLSPLRKALEFNESVWATKISNDKLAPEFDKSLAKEPKPNGIEGLSNDYDFSSWNLKVELSSSDKNPRLYTLDQLKQLPKTEMVTEFECVEGWSQIVHWAGIRLSDFIATLPPQNAKNLYMATPDEKYYVGIDMPSAMHPQTLLAYEMNGAPLTPIHGAPLRLVTALKYGYKSIKRLGYIRFMQNRAPDFWTEYQYDWFAGH